MDSITLDTLLVTLQQDATNETARNIIATVRDELELLTENLSWAHILISFYAEEHEKKLTPYTYSGDREAYTEEFVRNDSFRRHLEAQHPWLGVPRDTEARASDIANFNSAMQVERFKQEELVKRWPHAYGKVEEAPSELPDMNELPAPSYHADEVEVDKTVDAIIDEEGAPKF